MKYQGPEKQHLMIVTYCNRKFRMTHIFWLDQYKKGFSFIFLTKQKDDSLLELCWKVVMRKLSFRHHFSIKTLTSFLKAPTNWKWWSNNDFFTRSLKPWGGIIWFHKWKSFATHTKSQLISKRPFVFFKSLKKTMKYFKDFFLSL